MCTSSLRSRVVTGELPVAAFLDAFYRIINENEKFKVQSNELLLIIGFESSTIHPQLFMYKRDDLVVSILAKKVNFGLIAVSPKITERVIDKIDGTFELGTIVHEPGPPRFFGLNLVQNADWTMSCDGDDKLSALSRMLLSRSRRKKIQ